MGGVAIGLAGSGGTAVVKRPGGAQLGHTRVGSALAGCARARGQGGAACGLSVGEAHQQEGGAGQGCALVVRELGHTQAGHVQGGAGQGGHGRGRQAQN